MPTERIIRRALQTVRELTPPERIDTLRRADYALDNKGNVIDRARTFIRLQSPDGSVWRVKVDNAGALSTSKET